MRHTLLSLFLLAAPLSGAIAQQSLPPASQSWTADNGNGTFTNPLFYDEFSDPDILRVGDDYYLAGTTMHTVPGVNILHSKDLVNWEQAGYCFDRYDFPDDRFALKNHKEIYGQGIWAPCIRYHDGQFYVFSNVNGIGLQVYIAKDVRGPWKHINTQAKIYDLGILFDDNGKVYAIHGYGTVKCTELDPQTFKPIDGTERVIIPEGNGVGEGHHFYKINGMYYLISTDYAPNGRTLCSRSKNVYGPYETTTIEADETYGYHPGNMTQYRGRVPNDSDRIGIAMAAKDATGCANAHQGGIVSTPDGQWWALLMQDFHSIGRTVDLMPVTWKDGWPYVGLEGNLGRAPRTWLKPQVKASTIAHAPYQRNEDFNGKQLGRVWQWNHNPDDKKWALKDGKLRLYTMPAEQLLWARNTLTQRVQGPVSDATVVIDFSHLKDGDVAGLGNINIPCSWAGVVNDGGNLTLRWFEQIKNDTIDIPLIIRKSAKTSSGSSLVIPNSKIWLRLHGDYDDDRAHYEYSTDGSVFKPLGHEMTLSYQLITFQGSRAALFAFNHKGKNGGYALFDNFTVNEPLADRSKNIPYGKTFRIINLATNSPMIALRHGIMHDTGVKDKSEQTKFQIEDRGQGRIALKCADGRYVRVSGAGMPGDLRFTTDAAKASLFMWQDYLNHEFMLLSMDNHRYVGKSPTTGSSYSCDFTGPDPNRKNGAVLKWEECE